MVLRALRTVDSQGVSNRRQFAKKKIKEYSEKGEIPLDNSAGYRHNKAMSKIRKIILKEMERASLTAYRVCKMVEGKVPRRTVYDFLSGKSDTSTEAAWIIMEALGLTITNKSNAKRGKRPRKEAKS